MSKKDCHLVNSNQGIRRVCSHLHFDLPGLLGQEAGLLLSFKGLGLDVMRLHCA